MIHEWMHSLSKSDNRTEPSVLNTKCFHSAINYINYFPFAILNGDIYPGRKVESPFLHSYVLSLRKHFVRQARDPFSLGSAEFALYFKIWGLFI